MRIFLLILFFALGGLSPLLAQNTLAISGGRSAAMGRTGVASYDFWSVYNNQAGLGFAEQSGVGFYYENHFLINKLNYNQFSAIVKTKMGGFGLNVSYSGYADYNEKRIGLAYGKALGKRFALGVQLDYLNTFIAYDYGSKSMITFEVGLMAKITDDLTLGAHVFNPVKAKLSDYDDERIPAVLNIGLNWDLQYGFVAAVEAESDMIHPLILKAGVEYNVMDLMYLRIGMSNNPNIFSFGVGLHLKGFTLDFASSMHQVLGYSPQVSATYEF
jgi:hypothetical protein